MVEQATNPVEQQDEPLPDPFVVSTSLRRRLQSCYEKAIKLTEQDEYDHDYVHTMLTECVMRDPNNLVYVESFLDNLAAKYNNNKRGARLKGFGGKGAFKKLVSKEEWAEILKSGPDLLKTNPWDAQILRAMADACAAFHYNEVELRYLKNALEGKPKDPDVKPALRPVFRTHGDFQSGDCLLASSRRGVSQGPRASEDDFRFDRAATIRKQPRA